MLIPQFNAEDLETTTSGYLIWNNEVYVVFKGQKAGENDRLSFVGVGFHFAIIKY